jgi:hypothetical protein
VASLQVPVLAEQLRQALLKYEYAVDAMVAARLGSRDEREWRERARHWSRIVDHIETRLNYASCIAEGRPWLWLLGE